jgi:GH18 family chitinase
MKKWKEGILVALAFAILALICPRSAWAEFNSPLVLGYYTNWSTYAAKFTPDKIPAQVDEILYAFMEIGDCDPLIPPTEKNYATPGSCKARSNKDGTVIYTGTQDYKLHTTDAWSDFYKFLNGDGVNIGGLGNLGKALKTGKRVELSIGGWTLSAAIRGAIQPANVDSFVSSIIALMHQAEADAAAKGISQKFDGVDIDWEPNGNLWTLPPAPGSEFVQVTLADLNNYLTFLTKLKSALTNAGYSTLTIAMTANPAAIEDVEVKHGGYWKALSDAGVLLNLMTYDYNGQAFTPAGCTTTGFNSPLYLDDSNPCFATKTFVIDASLGALQSVGVPGASIGIGVPAYGRAYSIGNVDTKNKNPYVTFINKPATVHNVAVPDYGDVWTYRELMTGLAYGAGSTNENTTWVPIAHYISGGKPIQSFAEAYVNRTPPAWISFTGFVDAQAVMTYAKSFVLHSVMVWAIDQDVQPGDPGYNGQPLDWNTTSIIAGLASKK